jgi:catechol 2,3-dioxygenase-like lactoylglutathione lyase family enzyme
VRVEGVSWVGVRTDRYAEMAGFFRDVVGLQAVFEQHDFLVFRMPDGDQVEIFGPDGPNPPEQFAHGEVVAGLRVDDIEAATEELRQAGIELIGGRQGSASGYSWQHFRAPDGKVFELCHDPEHDRAHGL